MRVNLAGDHFKGLKSPFSSESGEKIPEQEGTLGGVITRITSDFLFLRLAKGELKISLQGLSKEQKALLKMEQSIEISWQKPGLILLRKLPSAECPRESNTILSLDFENVVLELDLYPSLETKEIVKILMEKGLPLHKELVFLLLPWARRGLLEEALQLLQGQFPLTEGLMQVLREMKDSEPGKPLLSMARPGLSRELKQLLENPEWIARSQLGRRLDRKAPLEQLTTLYVQERIAESLLNRANLGSQFLFALPFLLGTDLHASWVWIGVEDGKNQSAPTKDDRIYTIELQIPTATLGLVAVHLSICDKRVDLIFYVEKEESQVVLKEVLDLLRQRLLLAGWFPAQLGIELVPKIPTPRWVI